MFKKYYVAETLVLREDGKSDLDGTKMEGIWFWQSPMVAIKRMLAAGEAPVNFRRIK